MHGETLKKKEEMCMAFKSVQELLQYSVPFRLYSNQTIFIYFWITPYICFNILETSQFAQTI